MGRSLTLLLPVAVFFFLRLHVTTVPASAPTWSDEFNYTGAPDSSKWGYEKGYVRNKEWQYYTDTNAWCDGAQLIIRAQRNGAHYTSSSITTRGKYNGFGKGYYEIRARFPAAAGMWPAWWTLGNNVSTKGWPYCGEIDMLEYYRDTILHNVMNSTGQWVSPRMALPSGYSNKYHVYGMHIDDTNIYLCQDGDTIVTYPLSRAQHGSYNPFRQTMYMILNLAIGGTQGGDATNTPFPQSYYVDYVRYWAAK